MNYHQALAEARARLPTVPQQLDIHPYLPHAVVQPRPRDPPPPPVDPDMPILMQMQPVSNELPPEWPHGFNLNDYDLWPEN